MTSVSTAFATILYQKRQYAFDELANCNASDIDGIAVSQNLLVYAWIICLTTDLCNFQILVVFSVYSSSFEIKLQIDTI